MRNRSPAFRNIETAPDDTCILAFTSGTTGMPKATMHFHRDVLSICVCWPAHVLRPKCDDVFIGSPPLAFTFGLGGLLLFPMSVGASTVLLENVAPEPLVHAIDAYGATILFTAPTAYLHLGRRGTRASGCDRSASARLPRVRARRRRNACRARSGRCFASASGRGGVRRRRRCRRSTRTDRQGVRRARIGQRAECGSHCGATGLSMGGHKWGVWWPPGA